MYIDARVMDRVECAGGYVAVAYPAERTEVVLGRSTSPEEIHAKRCRQDGVPVLRRAGGGGVVVLCRGTVVISVAGISRIPFRLREHMSLVNERIISALSALGVEGLSLQGISDIAIGDRKLLGSSLYRKRDTVLYQGSLLVAPDLRLIDRYLKHPLKEPAYRRRRSHADFITSLQARGYRLAPEQVAAGVREALEESNPWEGCKPGTGTTTERMDESPAPGMPVRAGGGEQHEPQ